MEVTGFDDERAVAVEEDSRFSASRRRSKAGEKFFGCHGGGSEFSDDNTGGVIGEHGCLVGGGSSGDCEREGSDNRVARTGDVEYFPGKGGDLSLIHI